MRKDQILERQMEEMRTSNTIEGLHATIARLTEERDEFRESYRLAMVSVNDAFDKGFDAAKMPLDIARRAVDEQIARAEAAEKENERLCELLRLKTDQFHYEAEQNAILRAQVEAARGEGYRQGISRAMVVSHKLWSDGLGTFEVYDALRAEPHSPPRTYEQGAADTKIQIEELVDGIKCADEPQHEEWNDACDQIFKAIRALRIEGE